MPSLFPNAGLVLDADSDDHAGGVYLRYEHNDVPEHVGNDDQGSIPSLAPNDGSEAVDVDCDAHNRVVHILRDEYNVESVHVGSDG